MSYNSTSLNRGYNEPDLLSHSGWTRPNDTISPFICLAIDIFSISAMSSEAERVFFFFGTKHTISDERESLHITTGEARECLKSWFWAGLFTNNELSQTISVGIIWHVSVASRTTIMWRTTRISIAELDTQWNEQLTTHSPPHWRRYTLGAGARE